MGKRATGSGAIPGLLRHPAVLSAGIFVFAWLLYANTLSNGFVWDDRVLVVENPYISSLDAAAVTRLFTTHYWDVTGKPGGLYRPVSALSFHLDYRLHGESARGFHATNATLNALVCTCVFVLVFLLFGGMWRAGLVAVLFAALPLHTENVAWISGRTDLLATLFMLVSFIAYVKYRPAHHHVDTGVEKPTARGGTRMLWLGLAVVAWVVGVLAKEFALVLPPVVIVAELWVLRAVPARSRWVHAAAIAVTFAIVAVGYFAVRRAVLGASVQSFEPVVTGVSRTLALALSTLAHYVYELCFPFLLNAESQFPVPDSLADPQVVVGAAMVAAAVVLSWRYRRHGAVVLSAAIFFAGIAPVLHFFPITQVSAERFLYFPSLGFVLLVGAGIAHYMSRGGIARRAAMLVALLLIVSFSARTVARNGDWKNETTLFASTVASAENNARAHLNLGNAHYRAGRAAEALAEYRKAVELDPDYAAGWNGAAGAYKALGQIDEALSCSERAIALAPRNADYYNSRGLLLIEKNDYEAAAADFRRAATMNPNHHKARFNLGLAEYLRGNYAESRAAFAPLPFKDTQFVYAYFYLAECELALGNTAAAVENARKFLNLHDSADQYAQRARAIATGAP